MSLKQNSVRSNTIGFVDTSELTGFVDAIQDATITLSKVKNVLETTKKIVSPFLSFAQTDPISTLLKEILKTVNDTINSMLSTGASFIFISPLNAPKKRYLEFKVDIKNINNFVTGTKNVINNFNKYFLLSNDELKSELLRLTKKTDSEKYTDDVRRITAEIARRKTLNYDKVFTDTMSIKIPKLSSKEALTDLINSFSNSQDSLRPTWNDLTCTGGLGILICAESQVQLIENLSFINDIFKFADIHKAFTDTKDSIDKYITTANEMIKNNEETTNQTQLMLNIQGKTESKDLLLQHIYAIRNNMASIIPMDDTSATWTKFSLDILPYIKDLKEFLDKLSEYMISATATAEDILTSIISAFLNKLDSLIKLISDAIALLNKLANLKLGVAATSFIIEPSEQSRGVSYLTSSLRELSDFSGSLFNPLINKNVTEDSVELLKTSQFSILLFLGVGFTSKDAVQAELNRLLKLFNITFDTLASLTTAGQKQLEQSYTTNNSMSIQVLPDYQDTNQVISSSTVSFKVSLSPAIDSYSYKLVSVSSDKYNKSPLAKSGQNTSYLDIVCTGLPDLTTFNLYIYGYSSSLKTSVTKNCYFSTDFSLAKITKSSSGISSTSSGVQLGSTENTFINNSNTQYTVEQKSILGTINTSLFPGGSVTLPTIPSGDMITRIINSNGKYLLTSSKSYLKYSTLSDLALKDRKIFIKSEPYPILFPISIAKAISIYSNLSWDTYNLPEVIELSSGVYPCQLNITGNWSSIFNLEVILSTDPKDFCLDLFTPTTTN